MAEVFPIGNDSFDPCFEEEIRQGFRVLIVEQFWLSVVVGSSVALVGLMANFFLISILKAKQFRQTNCLYLLAITLIDVSMELNYICLISVALVAEYFEWAQLHNLWGSYALFLYAIGQIAPVTQTGIIVAVSFDRLYMGVRSFQAKRHQKDLGNNNNNCTTETQVQPSSQSDNPKLSSHRYFVIGAFVLWSVLFKGSTFFEVETTFNPECSGFAYVSLHPATTMWIQSSEFKFYKFWIVPVFQVYLPFITLMVVNALIVTLWRREMRLTQRRTTKLGVVAKEFRGATYSLIIIISAYLISNVVNVIVALCEQLYSPQYLMLEYRVVYTLSSDLSSILVMTTCASRLPTYFTCNSRLRKEMLRRSRRFRNSEANAENSQSIT